MQKETRNLLLTAVGAFVGGVVTTFLILCAAIALTRPCPCKHPMPGMHPPMIAPAIHHGMRLPPHKHHGPNFHHGQRPHYPRPMPEQEVLDQEMAVEEIED